MRSNNQNDDGSLAGQAAVAGTETVRTKILFLMLDYDGCLAQFNSSNGSQFIDFVMEKINASLNQGYETCKVILAIGSNRQSPNNDRSNRNRNGNGSCVSLLPAVQDVLLESLKAKGLTSRVSVEYSPIMMPDIYHNNAVGTTFESIKAEIEKRNATNNLFTVFDETKITLIYTLCASDSETKTC